eukprot:GEMP01004112.1.p1 GENE.GEMP01004112.1~~GEMP01004112.1.p1  ORF type:complete len:1023 (+),score=253.88 GEMP01004112.1:211-3069(+)
MQSSLLGFREFLLGQKLPPSHFVRYIEHHTFTQDISLVVLQKLEKFHRPLDFSSGKLHSLHHRILPTPFLLMSSLDGYQDLETLKKQKTQLPDQDVREIVAQTLQAISILGKLDPPLIHRGIRLKNILWNAQQRRIKIAGCDNLVEATEPHIDRLGGAEWTQHADWLPQEACCMLTHLGPATSVDIFSVANLVMDLINVKRDKTKERFNQMDPKIIMQQVHSKQLRPIGLNSDLMLAMLASDSTRRPTPDHVLEKLSYRDTMLEDHIIPTLHEIAGRQRKKESLEKIPAVARVLVDRIEMHDKFIETILNMSRHEGISVYRLVCVLDFMFKSCGPTPELAGTISKFAPLANILVTKARGYLDPANVRKINDMSNYWENRGWITHNTDQLHAHPIQPIQPPGHIARTPTAAGSRQVRTPMAPGGPSTRAPSASGGRHSARTPTAASERHSARTPRGSDGQNAQTPRGAGGQNARTPRGAGGQNARTPRGSDGQDSRAPTEPGRRQARAPTNPGRERSRSPKRPNGQGARTPIDYSSARRHTGTDQTARGSTVVDGKSAPSRERPRSPARHDGRSPRTPRQSARTPIDSTSHRPSSPHTRHNTARTPREGRDGARTPRGSTSHLPRTPTGPRTPTRQERSRSAQGISAVPEHKPSEKSRRLPAGAADIVAVHDALSTQALHPPKRQFLNTRDEEAASSIASPCSFPSEDGWHAQPPKVKNGPPPPHNNNNTPKCPKKAPPPPPPSLLRAIKAPPPPPPAPKRPQLVETQKITICPVKAKHARKAGGPAMRGDLVPSGKTTRKKDESPSSSATSTPPRDRDKSAPKARTVEHHESSGSNRRHARFGAAKAPPAPRTSSSGGVQESSAAIGSDNWPVDHHPSPRGAVRSPQRDTARGTDASRSATRGRAQQQDAKQTHGDFRRNGAPQTHNNKQARSRTPPQSNRQDLSRDYGGRR